MATTSAWSRRSYSWNPSPTTASLRISTQPTAGLGEARPTDFSACCNARSIHCWSISGILIFLIAEQRVYKGFAVKRQKVVQLLSHSYISHRHFELARNSYGDTALRGPVELGEHDARHARRLGEQPRLLQSVLSRGRVHHQQNLVGSAGNDPFRGSPHLAQLLHQAVFSMQSACGVDDQDVCCACLSGTHGIEQDGGRVPSLLGLDHLLPRTLAPNLELFDGCGAEGIGRTKQDCFSLAAEIARQFSRRCRLTGAVHAHQH